MILEYIRFVDTLPIYISLYTCRVCVNMSTFKDGCLGSITCCECIVTNVKKAIQNPSYFNQMVSTLASSFVKSAPLWLFVSFCNIIVQ